MDPDKTLTEIRKIIAEIGDQEGIDDLVRLADLMDALDSWLTKGGFLPREWARQIRL